MADLGAQPGLQASPRRALRISLVGGAGREDPPFVVAPSNGTEPHAEDASGAALTVNGEPRSLRLLLRDDHRTAQLIEDTDDGPRQTRVRFGSRGTSRYDGSATQEVVVDGWRLELRVEDAARATLVERATRGGGRASHGGPAEVRAIIPGRVVAVSVTQGDSVELGQQLLVVEAMKMQNEVRAPRSGVVARIAAGEGQTVDLGDLLVVLE